MEKKVVQEHWKREEYAVFDGIKETNDFWSIFKCRFSNERYTGPIQGKKTPFLAFQVM